MVVGGGAQLDKSSPREEGRVPTPEAAHTLIRRLATGLIWRCQECGYQRWSIARPAACPACHAAGETFVGLTAVEWRSAGSVPARVQVWGGSPPAKRADARNAGPNGGNGRQ